MDTRPAYLNLGKQFKRIEQAYAHFAYVAPVRQTARYAADQGARVYLYRFAVNGSVVGGADHGDQNDFSTFTPRTRGRAESVEEVAGLMHGYWTSFITRCVSLSPFLSLSFSFKPVSFCLVVWVKADLAGIGVTQMPFQDAMPRARNGLRITLLSPRWLSSGRVMTGMRAGSTTGLR